MMKNEVSNIQIGLVHELSTVLNSLKLSEQAVPTNGIFEVKAIS